MSEEKVVRDGKVAVLYSPGYGAGWSTWAHEGKEKWAVFAPEVVAWVEAGKPGGDSGIDQIVKSKFGEDDYMCTMGGDDLKIEWIPVGTAFKIDEYDGSESVVYMGQIDWYQA